jgi:alkanesulfonate monooxygenase SsuD/methylene tetrahydromethanopterin reductase-like flavin-dependent oxidoreductase (luciferase family)
MRFGLTFPLAGILSDLTMVAGLAQEAEMSGWDGCFVWDHLSLGTPTPLADPWLALALIAHATKRIRLGPLVTPLFRREPAKLAYETITLDHLSQGRLIMGVGLGSDMFGEISAFGGPLEPKVRAEMLDEGLAILTGLWTGEALSFEGKHYRLNRAQVKPPCLQRPRIPIWVAASWQRRAPMRRAARYDGVVPVRGDLGGPLSFAHLQEMVSYIQGLRPAPDEPFDVIYIGQSAGRQPQHKSELIDSYAQAGVNWWIEPMPFEHEQFEDVRSRVRLGPPR